MMHGQPSIKSYYQVPNFRWLEPVQGHHSPDQTRQPECDRLCFMGTAMSEVSSTPTSGGQRPDRSKHIIPG